jgi:hypothetical protein
MTCRRVVLIQEASYTKQACHSASTTTADFLENGGCDFWVSQASIKRYDSHGFEDLPGRPENTIGLATKRIEVRWQMEVDAGVSISEELFTRRCFVHVSRKVVKHGYPRIESLIRKWGGDKGWSKAAVDHGVSQ